MSPAQQIPNEAFAITFSDGERIYTSQCGLNVTLFLLEFYKLDYDLNLVAARLKPDAEGIALASIQDVLEAHGLSAEARSGIKVKDLRRPLKSGLVAIVPIKAGADGQARHYVVALFDASRGYLLIDVPRAAGPLFVQLRDTDVSEPVMLFVKRAPEPMSRRLEIAPGRLDLGRFALAEPGGQKPVHSNFRIKNRSRRALMVRLDPSCGCMRPDWTAGILEPGEVREVNLRTSPGSWGHGRYVRPIYVSFADRSQARLDVVAEAVSAEVLQKLKVSQTSFTVDCTRLSPMGETLRREVGIQFADPAANSLDIASSADWLTAAVAARSNKSAQLELIARVNEELFRDGRSEVQGEIRISAQRSVEPAVVCVRLFRRDLFRAEPAAVTVSRSSSSTAEVTIAATEGNVQKLELLGIESDLQGIQAMGVAQEEAALRVAIQAAPDTPTGQAIVRCRVRADRSVEGTLYVIANIVD